MEGVRIVSIPVWVLLGFAAWTIFVLLGTIGWYRWSRILTGRAAIMDFQTDQPQGIDWYRRAIRAHANCLENLPIYTAVVVAIIATGTQSRALDQLAVVLLIARICQTVVHVAFPPTNIATSVRFTFFAAQLISMIWMGVIVAIQD
jgi:uncharacterized MAPEG superfamily protein